ncbi:hypothetical protein [Leptolyngbya sp. O-77]|uniref:hypothetical protein n=1 Tax=Leptolyngbya sp. O-77 TaxID=1080068 RepID=UPI0012E3EB67|nr:hypothetical protein [Leptolyngbya sp. O-77]
MNLEDLSEKLSGNSGSGLILDFRFWILDFGFWQVLARFWQPVSPGCLAFSIIVLETGVLETAATASTVSAWEA